VGYYPVLAITDGAARVPLLSQGGGLYLVRAAWGRPQLKGGGTWKDSSLSDGRRLALGRWTNVIDVYTLGVRGYAEDDIAFNLQNLSRLLEAARAYWTGGELLGLAPVYVERQGGRETNIEYATIMNYNIPSEPDFFSQPLTSQLDRLATEDVALDIEHAIWSELPPGQGTAVQVAGQQTYNGVTYGRAATTAEEVYVGGRWNNANITHAYRFDASGPSYTQLIGAALPQNLYPAVPAAGDILYLGSDDAVADSGPFASAIFDILAAAVQITTIVFEYWNGAWVALPRYADNTAMFTATGVRAFSFDQPADWTTTAVNGVTAWWIRFRITVVGGAPTPPTQQNRNIYAVTWPAVSIASAQVAGDIPALARFIYTHHSTASPAPLTNQPMQRAMLGLRAQSRGADFRSYFNASDEQNPTGITCIQGGTSVPTVVTASKTPTGRAVRYNPAGANNGLVYWRFNSLYTEQYYGTYRVYVRCFLNSAVTDCYVNLRLQFDAANFPNTYYYRSPNIYPTNSLDFHVLDLGMVQIPGDTVKPGQTQGLDLSLFIVNGTGAPDLYIYDLAIIPVDEWSLDTFDPDYNQLYNGYSLDMDSVTSPRRRIYSDAMLGTLKIQNWNAITNGPAILQPNVDQKLHAFLMQWAAGSSSWYSYPHLAGTIQAYRNQRYLGARGAR
jgi:hypothetical protein